jgi:hypothetical protein
MSSLLPNAITGSPLLLVMSFVGVVISVNFEPAVITFLDVCCVKRFGSD